MARSSVIGTRATLNVLYHLAANKKAGSSSPSGRATLLLIVNHLDVRIINSILSRNRTLLERHLQVVDSLIQRTDREELLRVGKELILKLVL
jgi:hypothetical protein